MRFPGDTSRPPRLDQVAECRHLEDFRWVLVSLDQGCQTQTASGPKFKTGSNSQAKNKEFFFKKSSSSSSM